VNGAVLVEVKRADGRRVIALKRPGEEGLAPVTKGPQDFHPSFTRDGRGFLFVQRDRGAIVLCALDGATCRELHADPLGPSEPVMSPDGRWVAYNSLNGAARRLRVVDVSGRGARDLGPASSACTPGWAGPGRLWTLDESDASPRWLELDVALERTTGRVVEVVRGPGRAGCSSPPTADVAPTFTVKSEITERAEIRLVDVAQPPLQPSQELPQ
jgi:Tol biopolymer transport system component